MATAGLCLDGHIEGAVNLRDMGGFAAEGGRVRAGRVFRSGMTHHITRQGLDALAGDFGVRRVFDFRAPEEIEHAGRAPFEHVGITWRHVPVLGTFSLSPAERKVALAQFASGEVSWGAHYVEMIEHEPQSYRVMFTEMAHEEGLPAIFHCSAGRDRTGIAAALLLGLLGVSDEDIVEDYVSTGPHLQPHARLFRRPGADERSDAEIARMLITRAEHMHDFLGVLKARHGTSEGFLRDVGVPQEAIDEVRGGLVEQR